MPEKQGRWSGAMKVAEMAGSKMERKVAAARVLFRRFIRERKKMDGYEICISFLSCNVSTFSTLVPQDYYKLH